MHAQNTLIKFDEILLSTQSLNNELMLAHTECGTRTDDTKGTLKVNKPRRMVCAHVLSTKLNAIYVI